MCSGRQGDTPLAVLSGTCPGLDPTPLPNLSGEPGGDGPPTQLPLQVTQVWLLPNRISKQGPWAYTAQTQGPESHTVILTFETSLASFPQAALAARNCRGHVVILTLYRGLEDPRTQLQPTCYLSCSNRPSPRPSLCPDSRVVWPTLTRAHAVAADALLDEVRSHCLAEPDDSRLAGTVHTPIHHTCIWGAESGLGWAPFPFPPPVPTSTPCSTGCGGPAWEMLAPVGPPSKT